MSEEEIKHFYNVYVLGKDTPNKLKLSQIFGKKVARDGNSERIEYKEKHTIRNVPEGKEDEITKEEKANENIFFYVYNVDDRETFEKFEKIHEKLNGKFIFQASFVLYGINRNIEHERSVSQEELIQTAFKNESSYFELQEFNIFTEKILEIAPNFIFPEK